MCIKMYATGPTPPARRRPPPAARPARTGSRAPPRPSAPARPPPPRPQARPTASAPSAPPRSAGREGRGRRGAVEAGPRVDVAGCRHVRRGRGQAERRRGRGRPGRVRSLGGGDVERADGAAVQVRDVGDAGGAGGGVECDGAREVEPRVRGRAVARARRAGACRRAGRGAFQRGGGQGMFRLGGGRRRGGDRRAQSVVRRRQGWMRWASACLVAGGGCFARRCACDGVDEQRARIETSNAMIISVRDQNEGAVWGAKR